MPLEIERMHAQRQDSQQDEGAELEVVVRDINKLRRSNEFQTIWQAGAKRFKGTFFENESEFACYVCGSTKMWNRRQRNPFQSCPPTSRTRTSRILRFASTVAHTCTKARSSSLEIKRLPPKPIQLTPLDAIMETLIFPRLPFIQIRQLRHEGAHGIIWQVINVAVNVNTMVTSAWRRLLDNLPEWNVW